MLIIVASVERELAGLRGRVRRGIPPAGGSWASAPDMHVLGMGPQAGPALASLLQRREDNSGPAPSGLLMLGVAGAVQPGLQTGDLVLSSRYYRPRLDETNPFWPQEQPLHPAEFRHDLEAGPEFLEPNPELWQRASAAAGNLDRPVVYADSLTVGSVVATATAKQDIHRRYPAAIVNMEDYWVAQAALAAGVPFIAIRVVLDTAEQALPAYLCRMANSPWAAVAGASAMPWRLPVLLGLWRRFGIAQRALADFAVSFLGQASSDLPAAATPSRARSVAA